MNISHQGEVVHAANGEIQHPINVDTVSVILKCLCCSIGIPLNSFMAITITRFRRLRCRPRHFFLLGITLSYLSFFIPPAIELIYWALYPVESVCRAYVAAVVAPQGLLLTNMLLALTDRYLAINHPLLHRRKMTNRLAACLILTCSTLMVFLMKFVYIVQLGPIRCEIWLAHVKMLVSVIISLFASCVVLNIIIYRQTKTLLRESRTLKATRDEIREPSVANANHQSTAVSPMRIHADRDKLSQMEMEATRTLVIAMASLCVMPCLALIFNASYFACRLISGPFACSSLVKIVPLVKELSLTPAIYGPIIFLARNKEPRASS
jgi:dopamine receptor D1